MRVEDLDQGRKVFIRVGAQGGKTKRAHFSEKCPGLRGEIAKKEAKLLYNDMEICSFCTNEIDHSTRMSKNATPRSEQMWCKLEHMAPEDIGLSPARER